jgi:hypothetical protein
VNFGNIQGLVNGTEQVVYDYEVTGSAITSVATGSILNGDDDGWYTIIVRLVAGANSDYVGLRLNGDSGSNYGLRGVTANNTTIADSAYTAQTGMYFGVGSDSTNDVEFAVGRLYAKSGAVRLMNSTNADSITGTTINILGTYGQVWNNTADNITSMTFFAPTNGLGVGTRIIILKSNNFTDGTPTGVITTPYIKGAWVRVGTQTLGSATSTVTFSGLDGDTDVIYYLSAAILANAVNANPTVRLNNDSTAGIYGYQALYGANTTVAGGRGTHTAEYAQWNNLSNGNYALFNLLTFAKAGYVRTGVMGFVNDVSSTTVTEVGAYGHVYNQTSNNITSIVITSSATNAFATGSQFELYALRPNG